MIPALLIITEAGAQEQIAGLQRNRYVSADPVKKSSRAGSKSALELPFFDDFSRQSPRPNQDLWADNFVFINNTYSENQLTKGVATFDALDAGGMLYATISSAGFRSDQLTSQPVNLGYPATDNIWLSFYYEPGGLSDMPELKDSLTLQFYAPLEDKWYSVWRAAGGSSVKFTPVTINIRSERYLRNGFRFRFVNYASVTSSQNDFSMIGNCDIWNIDYVMLDRNRNSSDTVNTDVAFRLPLRSLLKNHEAMPWKQYQQVYLQEMGAVIPVSYRNNDTITRNVTRFFEIFDVTDNTLAHAFSGGATNVAPLSNVRYNAGLIYTYSSPGEDSAVFKVTAILKTDEFDPKSNDTLTYFQRFSNYFSFDDGSAEAGYGINGLGSRNAMFAYRFRSYTKDTLRAIRICFNDSYQNANKRAFDLMVWADDNGKPGDPIYITEEVMVENTEGVNSFYTYKLPDGVPVSSVFYIGWRQRSETFLNAGFDSNTPNEGRQFYWLNGSWYLSQVRGSVMIRAVVGAPLRVTAIDDIKGPENELIRMWPNPVSSVLNFSRSGGQVTDSWIITFTDMSGREIMEVPFSEQVDVSSLRMGMYIVTVSSKGNRRLTGRIIKTMF